MHFLLSITSNTKKLIDNAAHRKHADVGNAIWVHQHDGMLSRLLRLAKLLCYCLIALTLTA